MKKPFQNVDDQINILKRRGITIDDLSYAKNFLISRNYYSMINDYGRFFTVSSDVYISGTTLKDINCVYIFDKAIKTIIFTHVLECEKYLKSTLAYYFCEYYPEEFSYLNTQNYRNATNKQRLNAIDIINRIAKVIQDYSSNKKPPNGIKHYSKNHSHVPLWVVIQFMYLGDVIKLYECCNDAIQTKVVKVFSSFLSNNVNIQNYIMSTKDFLTILKHVRDFRNCIAHNNRILNMYSSKTLPYIQPIHGQIDDKNMHIRSDLYNTLLIFKCLISPNEYENMQNSFKNRIKDLKRQINIIDYNKITCALGFPENWINMF